MTQIVAVSGFSVALGRDCGCRGRQMGTSRVSALYSSLDRAIFRRAILPPRDILHFRLLKSLFHVKQAQFTVPARAGLSKEGFPMKILDGFGKQCPMPLVMAKKELDTGVTELAIQVDNETAVKNLTRLGKKKNMATSVDKIEGGWLITFGEGDGTEAEAPAAILEAGSACSTTGGCGYSVFVGKDFVGDGDLELGRNLMKMALCTLSEAGDPPTSLLFMNAGVKLVAPGEEQAIEAVKKLEEQGTEVLVCGTCLNFFGIADKLSVGEVSNMYDILERMRESAKTITL